MSNGGVSAWTIVHMENCHLQTQLRKYVRVAEEVTKYAKNNQTSSLK